MLKTSNDTTTKDDSGIIAKPSPVPNPIPSAVGGLQNLQAAAQGSTQSHSSKRPNVALIGGVVAGIFGLLLIALAIILFRRRGVQHGLRGDVPERDEELRLHEVELLVEERAAVAALLG